MKGTLILFLEICCAAVTKKYWAVKIEKIVSFTFFFLYFLQLLNIRGTFSKFFDNKTS